MNKLLLSSIVLLLIAAAAPNNEIVWLGPLSVDVGDILRDEPVDHVFEFRNETGAPLLIDNVRTSCGCTTTEWQDSPVMPDSIGRVRVSYNAFKRGYFRKYAKVYFFGQRGAHKLWLEGYVE